LPDQSFVLNSSVSHIRLIPFNRSEISRTVGQPFIVVVRSVIVVVYQSVDGVVVVFQAVDVIVGDVKLVVNVVVVSQSVVVVVGDVELVVDGVVFDIHAAVVSR
jgi:hypothetical protein